MSRRYSAIVMGASAGGWQVLNLILSPLPFDLGLPILIVRHTAPSADDYSEKRLNEVCGLTVTEGEDKQIIQDNHIYLAPPNYHLQVEQDRTLSLSICEPVNYARPSIDVLFETAAEAYGPELLGILLTGASSDGSEGLRYIAQTGGMTIIQDPVSAHMNIMPRSAINLFPVDHVMTPEQITRFILDLKSTDITPC